MVAIMYAAAVDTVERRMRWVGLSLMMSNVGLRMLVDSIIIVVGLAERCIFNLGFAKITLVWSVMRINYQNCIYYLSFSLIFLNLS